MHLLHLKCEVISTRPTIKKCYCYLPFSVFCVNYVLLLIIILFGVTFLKLTKCNSFQFLMTSCVCICQITGISNTHPLISVCWCSRIPGHWVQPPPPADAIWASYLAKPKWHFIGGFLVPKHRLCRLSRLLVILLNDLWSFSTAPLMLVEDIRTRKKRLVPNFSLSPWSTELQGKHEGLPLSETMVI